MKSDSFRRKIIYGACIVGLLILNSFLSQPSTGPDSPGGLLAQKRAEYRIAKAELGEIDPTSEAMRLSMLGMDGIATLILWNQLNEYQKTEQYDHVNAICEQITHLNPHFLSVWEYQAWNLSYNISREFDNYRHRYLWVKKGLEYQMAGTKYNFDEPKLMNSVAHFFGIKFGYADEKAQYREIFPEDHEFHAEIDEYLSKAGSNVEQGAAGVGNKPDNWLVARLWNQWADRVVDTGAGKIGNASPAIFFSNAPKRLMSFAEFIEKEGHIGDTAQTNWEKANKEWTGDYGDRDLPTSWGIPVKLNDYARHTEKLKELRARADELIGPIENEIREAKKAKLPEDQIAALKVPAMERSGEQELAARKAEEAIQPQLEEIIQKISDPQKAVEVRRLYRDITDYEFLLGIIDKQKSVVHFDYWNTRSASEMTERSIRARSLVYQANQAFEEANLVEARDLYNQAWALWAEIYKEHPELEDDAASGDLSDELKTYAQLLEQLGETLPADFPLVHLMELHIEGFQRPAPPATTPKDESTEATPEEEKPAAEKPAEESTEKPAAEAKEEAATPSAE
ncbi:hypothetical protein LOC68_18045 [Blastopirellula sp. JC732]|uniref:IRE (Iron responsive element) n=1 Tax=Blastopirellula sediminis TaxID=2894196 RepID=A0A9X1MPE9_9BACT|nr:hypothetical protein [Blastopirellula sediminis]MCC9606401.1 hypothetical protein [Blastopirellula sediminis]MCC9630301.1 hypothetical protein [Blastopirellula sediminis]